MFGEENSLLIFWLIMRLDVGSNKELAYMLMHLKGQALKGLNFQGWPNYFLLVVLPRILP